MTSVSSILFCSNHFSSCFSRFIFQLLVSPNCKHSSTSYSSSSRSPSSSNAGVLVVFSRTFSHKLCGATLTFYRRRVKRNDHLDDVTLPLNKLGEEIKTSISLYHYSMIHFICYSLFAKLYLVL